MIWLYFTLGIAMLLFLDLGVLHRRARDISLFEALALSGFWISIGLGFAVIIYYAYEHHWISATVTHAGGDNAVVEYITAYLVELSLSLDNLFVIALIFSSLHIPLHHQHRVLFWGIIGAIVMRALILMLGVVMIRQYLWLHYVFGAILLFTAVKFWLDMQKPPTAPGQGWLASIAKRMFPYSDTVENGNFFLRRNGTWVMTPLFIALLVVETADLLFALDSLPAVMGISSEAFIVVSSNVFAILGLRAMYFVLAAAIARMHYLKVTLTLILGFIGIKMLIAQHYAISPATSLLIIVTFLVLGVISSLLKKHEPIVGDSPLGQARLDSIYEYTLASLRRGVILIVGTSVLIVGIIMIVTPGPAIIVIPAGLAILATEFVWARRLLEKFKAKVNQYRQDTAALLRSKNESKNTQQPDSDSKERK